MADQHEQPAYAGRSPFAEMDRWWFLTWTTYGTWLPGDERGFVTNVVSPSGTGVRHNEHGTSYDADMIGLKRYAESELKGPPVYLDEPKAVALAEQFHETTGHRSWFLAAFAVMVNHAHIVVGVPGDPDPEDLLRDFKAYGSRKLNRSWTRPRSGTWWTESGSKRKQKTESQLLDRVRYVRDQHQPLVVWLDPRFALLVGERGA